MKHWLGQATTGAGFATVLASLSAVASGTINWQQACPALVGGMVGLLWPENKNLAGAGAQVATDALSLVTALQNRTSAASSSAAAPSVPPAST